MRIKTILSISILSVLASGTCLAFSHHYQPFYVGGDLGYGDSNGPGGRLFTGFDINQNVALELGYTIYKPPYKSFNCQYAKQSLDFLAKLSVPISCNASLYAKGGLAYVQSEITHYIDSNDLYLRPTLGAGISYSFTSQVAGNIGYYRTFGAGPLRDADILGAGITVHLG